MRNYLFLFITILSASCKGQPQKLAFIPDTHPGKANAISIPVTEIDPTPNGKISNVLFQSTDGGKNWKNCSAGLPPNFSVANVFTQDGEVFLTADENNLYHSHNPETSIWQKENIVDPANNERISGIYAGYHGPYVTVYDDGFYRKALGTNQWQPMHKTLKNRGIYSVLETPEGTLFVSCDNGIYKSQDDCKTWKHVFSGGLSTSLTFMHGVMLANGPLGLMRSIDNGEHWENVIHDENAYYKIKLLGDKFAAVRVDGPWRNSISAMAWVTPTYAVPLQTSTDGKNWQRMDQWLSPIQKVYNVVKVGDYLFCSHEKGVSRSSDGGLNWELVLRKKETEKSIRIELITSGETVYAVMVFDGGC